MTLDTPGKRLRWAREQHGKYDSATEAARAFGWAVSTYLGHENGDRNPSRAAAKRYARVYRVRWEWILEGEGSPTGKTEEARLVGYVEGAGQVRLYDDGQLRTVELPPGGNPTTVAIEIRGGSMRGIADSGWLFYFDEERRPPTDELLGKLCVLELDNGDVLIRTLQPGRKKNRYDLESATEPTLRDKHVVWAARITWIKPR